MGKPQKTILQPGDIIGGCTIKSLIASGGMGEVYLAFKTILEKDVAIKVLYPKLLGKKEHLARFLREAKVAASIDHDATVKVYDFGEENGIYYMLMEYVEGTDLKSFVLNNGPLSPRKALRIIGKIANALYYAHNLGLIHRDIKPSNILLTKNGEPKLADFGLARFSEEDHEVTATGVILGTPVYMSPEQCRGDYLDGRSDLYSLGATLYYLLSGKVPFEGENTPSLIHKVINEMPLPLIHLVPNLPEKVFSIVKRLMIKHPAARFQNAHQLESAIEDILAERFVFSNHKNRKTSAHPMHTFPWGRLAYLIFVGIVIGGTIYLISTHKDVITELVDTPKTEASPQKNHMFTQTVQVLNQGKTKSPRFNFSTKDFKKLQNRAGNFLQDLLTYKEDTLFSYLDPLKKKNLNLQIAYEDLLSTISDYHCCAAKHRTLQQMKGKAESIFIFDFTSGRKSLKVIANWSLRNDTWYINKIEKSNDNP